MTTALAGILAALDAAAATPLVEYRGAVFTGADLRARIEARAADLCGAGLAEGQTVLIHVSENLAAMEQVLAVWWAGAGACLVDFRTPAARMAEWVGRLSPALVLGVRPVAGAPAHLQPRDPPPLTGAPPPRRDAPDQTALYLTSSGSTGLPRLAPTRQGKLAANLAALHSDPFTDEPGVTLSAISVAYSASGHVWLRNLTGARPILALDLLHRLDELDAALSRPEVTNTSLPPATIRRLAALQGEDRPRYPNLIRLTSVGGPARPEDKVAAVRRLTPGYVMTYSCVGIGRVARITGNEVLERPTSCGRPMAPVQVTIRDGMRLCGAGEIGEIVITTDRVTEARPGDLGWLDADGYLHVAGRVQGLLCRNGVNFSAERLTGAALDLPGVAEAAVAALPGADGGDAVHLAVQAAPGMAETLAAHLRRVLPAAEQPDRIHLWDSLPLTPAGKVDQRLLLDRIKEACDD